MRRLPALLDTRTDASSPTWYAIESCPAPGSEIDSASCGCDARVYIHAYYIWMCGREGTVYIYAGTEVQRSMGVHACIHIVYRYAVHSSSLGSRRHATSAIPAIPATPVTPATAATSTTPTTPATSAPASATSATSASPNICICPHVRLHLPTSAIYTRPCLRRQEFLEETRERRRPGRQLRGEYEVSPSAGEYEANTRRIRGQAPCKRGGDAA